MSNETYNVKAINDKRIALQSEINSNPVILDRTVFTKTDAERSRGKNLRQFFNKRMQKAYPELTNKNWGMTSVRGRCTQNVNICLPIAPKDN